MLAALIRRSFQRARGLLLSLGGVLVVFQVLVVIAAVYLEEEGGFLQLVALLPPVVQQMAGAVFASFGSMVAFGYFHPVVIIVFVGLAIVIAAEPAADVESGVVDLVLARPVRRWHLVTRSVLMTAATTVAIGALMVAASKLTIAMAGPTGTRVPLAVLVKLASNLVALAWALGALALALSAFARRRTTAAGAAGIIALALYLFTFLAGLWPRLKPYGPLSPFHYYQPTTIVSGLGTRWSADVAILLVAAAVLSLVAFIVFARRDL